MSDKELEDFCKFSEALNLSISSLEEIQQYRVIGTVEECREARERQRAKKPELYGDFEDGKLLCPNCEGDLMDLAECGKEGEMTNGDRIRDMSNKELATLLYNVYYDMHNLITYIDGVAFSKSCGKSDAERWLESESRRY